MKRKIKLILLSTILLCSNTGCILNKENTVVIYTSAESYRIEYMQERLHETFPEYHIIIEYMSTGDQAAKLKAEGKQTEADICYDLEYGYMEQLSNQGIFTNLEDLYDFSIYVEDAIESTYYIPEYRNGGAIIVDRNALKEKNLDIPYSYDDLLKPEYKNLISMPNPKSSGTGYMFLKALVNTMGEENAFGYFDSLAKNVLSFTSSGSGPINALVQKEVAIGLSITGSAVQVINDGYDLDVIFFKEGSPYLMYGQAMISGRENRECVKKVFDFLVNEYNYENNAKFFPEKIFKNKDFVIENYPSNIIYSDMSGNNFAEKTRLLNKWKY